MGRNQAESLSAGRRIAMSAAANYAGKFVTVCISFILTPFILRYIGPAEYGLWILVGSIAGYASLLDLGVANAVVKFIAEYHARHDLSGAAPLISTALAFYLAVGLIGIGLSAIGAVFAGYWLQDAVSANTGLVVFLIGINVALYLPGSAATAVLRGLQRFDIVNLLNTGGAILSAVAIVILLRAGGGLLTLVSIYLVAFLLSQVAALIVVRKLAPELNFGSIRPSASLLRPILSFSMSMFVVQVAGRLQMKSAEVVIGSMSTLKAVTPYAIAGRLSELPQIATDQFLQVILPAASAANATNDSDRLKRLFVTSTRITLAVAIPIGAALILLAPVILAAWVGPEYAFASTIAVVLTASSVINTSVWPAASILQAMSRHRVLALAALANGILNIGLSIFLFPYLGLVGVALGTLIPTVAECIFFVWPYAVRSLHIPWKHVLAESIVPAVAPMIPGLLILFGIMRLLVPADLIAITFTAVSFYAAYLGFYLLQPCARIEREMLFAMVMRVRKVRTITA